jgi:hypothetical protein
MYGVNFAIDESLSRGMPRLYAEKCDKRKKERAPQSSHKIKWIK